MPVGEVHARKLDARDVSSWCGWGRGTLGARLLPLVKHLGDLVNGGAHLSERIKETDGGVQRREHAYREYGHEHEGRRVYPTLGEHEAAHGKHRDEGCRRDGEREVLPDLAMSHPIDEGVGVVVNRAGESLVGARRATEGLDDLDAVHVFDRGLRHVVGGRDRAAVPLLKVPHHLAVGEHRNRNGNEGDERECPVERQHVHDDDHRHEQIARHLWNDMSQGRLDAVGLLDHDVLERARRRVEHVAHGHAGELARQEATYLGDGPERCHVRDGRGHVVKDDVDGIARRGKGTPAHIEREVAVVGEHAHDHLPDRVIGQNVSHDTDDGTYDRDDVEPPTRTSPLEEASCGVPPLGLLRPIRRIRVDRRFHEASHKLVTGNIT